MAASRLVVPIEPVGKLRARGGQYGQHYTPTKTRQAEKEIASLWMASRLNSPPSQTPFAIKVVARYSRPPSHRTRGGSVKDRYAAAAAGTPGNIKRGAARDIDNVIKLVLDALNGVAYDDDIYCTAIMATKEWAPDYSDDGELDITILWSDDAET